MVMSKLFMELDTLRGIPVFPLPEQYYIKPYHAGNEKDWLAIHLEADIHNPISETLFTEQFGNDPKTLTDRQLYLYYQDEIIGTATAWFAPSYKDGKYGRIHWVAIKPAYQGRGLSKPLLSKTCLQLINLGYTKAYLTTSSLRPIAVTLYNKFGFRIVRHIEPKE